jgi:NADP-dependent 3-hydroxy acid dehydrogenase YdfG
VDKVIVVTGASAGIGAALAKQLAGQGARLVLAARRRVELEQVAAECGAEALAVVTDVTHRDEVKRLRDAALSRFGRIDVWVNNAGRGVSRAVADLTDEDLDVVWGDNLKSALYGMQTVLPHFKQRNQGQIVNISSGLSKVPTAPIRSIYGAVKSALNMLSAVLRVELAAQYPGIQVSVVMPGIVATDFGLHALGGGPDSRQLPGAQPVEDAARAIAEVIEHPRPEAYTNPRLAELVQRYQRDPAAVEAEIAGWTR